MSDFGQGGGGGGFGPPPGGGGGFGPPPSGGGGGAPADGPLAHIPFTPDDEANLSGMARFAMFAGIAAVAAALIQMIVSVIQAFVVANPTQSPAGQVCGGIIGIGIAALLATFLFKASQAVKKVVETDDADQLNLVAALGALKNYFMVKGIVAILVICLVCCLGVLLAFAGAAVAGALSP